MPASQRQVVARMSKRMTMETPISDCEWSVRTENVLNAAGIQTIGDLCAMSLTRLRKLKNCGRQTVREICDMLAGYELGLAPDDDAHAPTPLKSERATITFDVTVPSAGRIRDEVIATVRKMALRGLRELAEDEVRKAVTALIQSKGARALDQIIADTINVELESIRAEGWPVMAEGGGIQRKSRGAPERQSLRDYMRQVMSERARRVTDAECAALPGIVEEHNAKMRSEFARGVSATVASVFAPDNINTAARKEWERQIDLMRERFARALADVTSQGGEHVEPTARRR